MGIIFRIRLGCALALAAIASLAMLGGVAAQEGGGALLVPAALTPAPLIGGVRSGLDAFGTPVNLSRRTLGQTDDVFLAETVETLAGGALHILFLDDTDFRLGEDSRMTLDEMVYDPDLGTGSLVIRLSRGIFRIASGAIPRESFRIVTPVATIGIRGTVFEVQVEDDGTTTVSVFQGAVEVVPFGGGPAGGRTVIAAAGQSARVSADGGDAEIGLAQPSDDPGLRVTGEDDEDDQARRQRRAERLAVRAVRTAERLLRRNLQRARTEDRQSDRTTVARAADGGGDQTGGGGNGGPGGGDGGNGGPGAPTTAAAATATAAETVRAAAGDPSISTPACDPSQPPAAARRDGGFLI
jgi:hypothetical protein